MDREQGEGDIRVSYEGGLTKRMVREYLPNKSASMVSSALAVEDVMF